MNAVFSLTGVASVWLVKEIDSLCGLYSISQSLHILQSLYRPLSHLLVKFAGIFFVNMHVNYCSNQKPLQPKMQRISLSGRAPPRPAGGAYSAFPDP